MKQAELIKPWSLVERIEKQINENQLRTNIKAKENQVIEITIIWPKCKLN